MQKDENYWKSHQLSSLKARHRRFLEIVTRLSILRVVIISTARLELSLSGSVFSGSLHGTKSTGKPHLPNLMADTVKN